MILAHSTLFLFRASSILILLAFIQTCRSGLLAAAQDAANEKQQVEAYFGPKLIIEPTRSHDRLLSFPIKFTAPTGESIGMFRALVIVPDTAWKFQKVELPSRSDLKVSARQQKRRDKDQDPSSAAQIIEITFSAGTRAIKDGLIGTMVFSVPTVLPAAPEPPTARIILTSPPEVEQSTNPADSPFALPPDATVNPAVGCFFFSH